MNQPPYPPPPGPPGAPWTGPQPAWQQPHNGWHQPPAPWPQPPPPPKPEPSLGCVTVVAAVILAVIVLVVVAVTGTDDNTTTSSPPAAGRSRAGLTDAEIQRMAMLGTIRGKYPKYERVPDATIVKLGEAACEALRSGASVTAVGLTLSTRARIGLEEAGYLIGAYVTGLCADQRDKIPT